MKIFKNFLGSIVGFAFLVALVFCVCAEAPDFCGESNRYDSNTQFCFMDEVHNKCGGEQWNPNSEFCFDNSVHQKCGGETYNPQTQTCENGKITHANYVLTVSSIGTGATGGGDYDAGETVSIFAGTAPTGHRFINWTSTSDGVIFANANSASTMFIMPSNDVTVVANFEELSVFRIIYNGNGNTGGTVPTDNTQYHSGMTVTVLGAGNLTKTDHVFSGWNTRANASGNSFAAGNTFNITENTTLYARWVDVSIPIFTVTVNSSGTGSVGDGGYEQGATIHINAGTAPEGQRFVNWTTTSAGVTFANANSATTTFTMPANAVTVRANFEAIPTFAVTVSSEGTGAIGAGNYVEGATVSISAGTAPVGHIFRNWTTTSGGVTFANSNNVITTFTMPANAVTVEANFLTLPSHFNHNITYGFFVDERDGQVYFTVEMPDGKTWMAENLNYNPSGTSGSWCHNNQASNCDTYGRLYDWATAMAIDNSCNEMYITCPSFAPTCNTCGARVNTPHRGVCPAGWHLPSSMEWGTMVASVEPSCNPPSSGSMLCEGASTKLSSSTGWNSFPNIPVGTNDFGFSALPSGNRSRDGDGFGGINSSAFWWTSTESGTTGAGFQRILNSSVNAYLATQTKTFGFSVRCVKD